MNFLDYISESIIESLKTIWTISRIIIPLMIIMEFLKEYKILDKISNGLSPIAKFLGVSKKSTFSLVIGLTLGLSYGAGVIIKNAKEGNLSKKDLYLLLIFLISCHSVFEDTFLFVAMGANGWLLLSIRITTAMILTSIVSKHIDKLLPKKSDNINEYTNN
mgnify:CR=1 FL=1